MHRIAVILGWCLFSCFVNALAREPGEPLREPADQVVSSGDRELVPHRLKALLHAPEVHEELGLSGEQVANLEAWFDEVDGPWFRARIQPLPKQWAELDRLEALTRQWMSRQFTASQRQRMQQLEWQSLGSRMLLRKDFAKALALTPDQQKQFAEIARATEQAQKTAQAAGGSSPAPSGESLANAIQAEREGVQRILNPEQQRRFAQVVGKSFPTEKLKRIYPMAPELEPTDDWINSKPLTLKSLRGKVVLLHFYAFQCHNCHANFNIYKRWHESLRERGVVVLGIQTPETSLERDANAVRKAAKEKQLAFPILIDLQSENWKAWGNTMWPTVYVIDKRGYIRHWWQGELNWQGATGDQTIEQIVESALAEPDPS